MILHATATGDGPDLLLLHGLFGAGKNLGAIARGLAAKFRVNSLDLRNHGSSGHAADMRYAAMAADVLETMDSLGIGNAVVAGHSMGGKAAMMMALTAPARVDALVAMDIAPIAYGHDYDAYLAAMRALPLRPGLTRHEADTALADAAPDAAMRAFLLNNLILAPAPHWRLGLDEIAGAMEDLIDWRDPEPLTPYDGPALFLCGGHSPYVPARAHGAIRARFPNAAIETLDGVGHWLHAEKPAEVIAALKGFLQ
ncbi:alpha/beta fold hydrolase [Acidiphilium sp. AL]|uniref:Alpha/beta fold hydrolase n=1 Tax=Acidiphilium iwatense TaxID=768198 RepID=A0ABS9DSK6_9PROT|nr:MULTISPECIES: alpha/beta fold hydrolase [Acidiphilium]MCF3945123.1 alpha/beta fold hydrolase [Acidiphilium iwatense]MCU4160532.1 alpha/beta fold hydrolase [Acidiphilium sp. AL]